MARRSLLFTPADRGAMLRKAADAPADALVFDLEDGVAPEDKATARETLRDVLADPGFAPEQPVYVRVNPIHDTPAPREQPAPVRSDVQALASVAEAIDGVVLPKTASAAEVRRLAGLLRGHRLPRTVLALIESAEGVQAAPSIARAGATDAVIVGTEDLAADVGSNPGPERTESDYARQRVVTAAAAAGIDAIDTLSTDFEDEAGLREDARAAVRLGFDGKLAIHPAQVGPINEAFTPDADEREWAERVLTARAEHDGGVLAVDGEMIDAPLVARAERIADRAAAAGEPLEAGD